MTILENKMEKKKNNHLHNIISKETEDTDSIVELIDFERPQSSAKLNISITKPDITKLTGVGPSVAEKLRDVGFNSIEHIAQSSVTQLTSIRGIGQATAQKIIEDAKSLLHRKNLNDFPEVVSPSASNTQKLPVVIPQSANEVLELPEDLEDFEDFEEEEEEVVCKPLRTYEPQPSRTAPLSPHPEIMRTSHQRNTEKMSKDEQKEIITKIISDIQGLGYESMKTVPSLRKIYSLVDIVAFKIIPFNELLDLVLILPIKVSNLKGELQISKEMIKYLPNDQNASDGSIYKTLLDSCFKQLEECQTLISQELQEEGQLIPYLKRFHNVNITLKKTLFKRNLAFHSGNVQIKILLEPILLSINEVGFLEKIVPFAYLKDINLHIISISHFTELLGFLEQKYNFLETYNARDTSLISYEGEKNQLLRRIELFSVPFLGFAGVLLFMLALKYLDILVHLLNFGYAFFGIYVIVLLYLNLKVFKVKTDLQQEFSTPYYKRDLSFDETSLVLINEELKPELMTQFAFECIGNNTHSKLISQIEGQQIEENVRKTQFESKVKKETFFEKKEKEEPEENEFVAKYSSFLED